jgi:hypothetical protein
MERLDKPELEMGMREPYVEGVATGFNHWYRFPYAVLLASGPGPLATDRSYIVEGRLPPDAAPPASVLPSSFYRPLRRPGAGPHTPPGHMAPRGATRVRRWLSGKAGA